MHLHSLRRVIAPHGRCYYVVGNSKFYGTLLPVEEIYATLFEDAGFTNLNIEPLRKRNSKKELYEYIVYAEARSGSDQETIMKTVIPSYVPKTKLRPR